MAKLTESYLRKLIKESIYDLYDDVEDIGAAEEESAARNEEGVYEIGDDIELAISYLEDDQIEDALKTEYALDVLRGAKNKLSDLNKFALGTSLKATNRADSMRSAAYKTGMPSASSEFGTTRAMDESRRRMAPKRK
jgi:hypothetical protein